MSKTAILGFGRLNPPTRGHQLVVNTLANQDGDPYLYLSHSCDPKKNPLDYETKLEWCTKSFGDKVTVQKSSARNMYEAARELYENGYTDLVYVCGSDRAEEAERMRAYNGKADKQGNIIYNFDSLEFVTAGGERINEDDLPIEAVSASKQRELAAENDLESFKENCPDNLDNDEREELFMDVRKGMGLYECLEELRYIDEAFQQLTKAKYTSEAAIDLDKKLKAINKKLNAPTKDLFDYKDDSNYQGLYIGNKGVSYSAKDLYDYAKNVLKKSPEEIVRAVDSILVLDKYSLHKSGDSISKKKASSSEIKPTTKTFTPVSLIKNVDTYIPLKSVSSNITFSDSDNKELNTNITLMLRTVVNDCIKNAKITSNKDIIEYLRGKRIKASSNHFSLSVSYDINKFTQKIGNGTFESLRSPFKNNFGEIFGASTLASILSKASYINFPGASNYPIADYMISDKPNDAGSFKVSAKAAKLGKAGSPVSEGGKPGCAPIIEDIYNGLKNGELDKKQYTKDFIQFIIFMKKNVVDPRGMHVTYENLANSLANSPSWLGYKLPPELVPFTVHGSVSKKNIRKFAKLVGKEKEVEKVIESDSLDYCETFRVKYMCQLFVKALNNNDSIISQFTKAISKMFGVFIQLYIDDNSDFINGNIKLFGEVVSANGEPLKVNGNGYHYEFLDNSALDRNYKLGTTKLSMKLKQ